MNTSNPKPIILNPPNITSTPSSCFPDPSTGGSVTWKTLISSPLTNSDSLTVGIATCAAGSSTGCRGSVDEEEEDSDRSSSRRANKYKDKGTLHPHRHTHPELYHFTHGTGVVTIDGEAHAVGKGSVVWIPGNAEHGVENTGEEGGEALVWLYVFAADGFGEVVYRFGEELGVEVEE